MTLSTHISSTDSSKLSRGLLKMGSPAAHNHPTAIFVRDPRYPVGGVETWIETLGRVLPNRGIRTLVLVPGSSTDARTIRERLPHSIVVQISQQASHEDQAFAIIAELEAQRVTGAAGVFFSGYYLYTNICALNLLDTPFKPIPVLHGRHPTIYDWVTTGPPELIVAPAKDMVPTTRREVFRRSLRSWAMTKVIHIPHGIDLPDTMKRRPLHPTNPINLVAIARLDHEAKRPIDYIRIAETLSHWHFPFRMTICGDGDALAAMKARARESLIKSVIFKGYQTKAQVYEQLQFADVFLSTSETEAYTLSTCEAIANGCVPIVTDIPGVHRDLVTRKHGIRVGVGDIDGFCREIVGLARNPDELRAKSNACMDLGSNALSSEHMANKYAALIRKVTPARSTSSDQRIVFAHATTGDFARARYLSRKRRSLFS